MDKILDTKTKLWHKKLRSTRNFIAEKSITCMSSLKVEEGKTYDMCQFGKQTNMSYKMFQHLTHVFELPCMDLMRLMQEVVIERKMDGHDGRPSNIEQPNMVQKKKLKKIIEYGKFFLLGSS